MKKITVNQFGISVMIICLILGFATCKALCQDTIHIKKVSVPYNILVNKQTGKLEKVWYRKVKVESGFITRKTDSTWLVNGREVSLNLKGKKP